MRKLLSLLLVLLATAHVQAQKITYSNNIASVIYTNCTYCHHSGSIAPFNLASYDDVYDQRYSIVSDITSHKMPPWPPDTKYTRLAHERILSPTQISMIKTWVDSGAVRGDTTNEPAVPTYNTTSVLKSIDLSKSMPNYTVAGTKDVYRCFSIPSGLSVDKMLTGIEFMPGNRKIVHHILLYWDTTGVCAQLDKDDPDPGYSGFGGVGTNSATMIAGWVPGSSSYELPTGMGMTIPKGADLVMQIHYAPGSDGEKDSTSFNMEFSSKSGLREVTQLPALNHLISMVNGPLKIPANSTKSFKEKIIIPYDVSVIGIAPHMHLIGQNMKVYAVTFLKKDTIPLIRINKWDFHWQGFYQFRKIVTLSAGTSVYAEADYDNTSNNPNNPNSPSKDVKAGESTTDEMMIVYFSFLQYAKGDENIVLDSSVLTGVKNQDAELSNNGNMNLYPVPVVRPEKINIELQQDLSGTVLIQLTDINGKVFSSKNEFAGNGKNTFTIETGNIPAGIYFCQVYSYNGMITKKVIVR